MVASRLKILLWLILDFPVFLCSCSPYSFMPLFLTGEVKRSFSWRRAYIHIRSLSIHFCVCAVDMHHWRLQHKKINFGILKKHFPLHAVCDILILKSIVYRFKKAQSFQPVGWAAFTLRVDKKISKKERQRRDGKSRGLPHQPGDETKFEWKDIETYHTQYSDAGGCMLCDHGSFHAVTRQ